MRLFVFIYLLVGLINVYGSHFLSVSERLYLKPLIMLSLITFFCASLPRWHTTTVSRVFLLGLVLSLIGDFFLLFEPLYISGILCFSLALSCYSYVFWRTGGFSKAGDVWIYMGMLILFMFVLGHTLWTLLSASLLASVVFYILTIAVFCLLAFARDKTLPGYFHVWIGSFCFIISNTIFGLETFFMSLSFGNALLIFFYIIAQYLIVYGMIKYFRRDHY